MEWAASFLIICFAAMVQTSTGFGFSIVAIPLLLFTHNGHSAITTTIFLSLISCIAAMPRIYKQADWGLLRKLMIGSLIGLPAGGLVYYWIDVRMLKLIVGAAILIFAISLLLKISLRLGKGNGVGMASGFLASSIGMPGPPIVLLLSGRNMEKGKFRGTAIIYFAFVFIFTLMIHLFSNKITPMLFYESLWLIPAIFIGQILGSKVHRVLSDVWFRRVTFLVLFFTGINAFLQNL